MLSIMLDIQILLLNTNRKNTDIAKNYCKQFSIYITSHLSINIFLIFFHTMTIQAATLHEEGIQKFELSYKKCLVYIEK